MMTMRARVATRQAGRWWLLTGMTVLSMLAGCGDQVRDSSAQQVAEFLAVEPMRPSIDTERVLQARLVPGPYCTRSGDILRVEMPRVLDVQPAEAPAADGMQTYTCRIHSDGTIVLPTIGAFHVAGESLAQIETDVLAQYYPKYIKTPFPVYVTVSEYDTRKVSVVGAVARPGVYALRWDQMSLVSLLMEAGGIVTEGAMAVRIDRRVPSMATPTNFTPATMNLLPGAGSARTSEPASNPPALRVTFEREGPLCATGRLAVADADGLLVERWVDLASATQRSEFVRAAEGTTRQVSASRLQGRLVELATVLESLPPQRPMDAGICPSPWRVAGDGRYVTLLDAPAGAREPGFARTVAAKANEAQQADASETLVLPVRGLNIPFADAPLQEGDSVVVERLRDQLITVLGLVRNPGTLPYPPDTEYNLVQAIGLAGGLDMIADPRYVSIYRLKSDGEIASLTIRLVDPRKQGDLTGAQAISLRPGDVVSVEHTPRTRTNVFMDRFFRLNFGMYLRPETLWEDR